MRGRALARGGEPEQLVLIDPSAVHRNDVLHDKVALGDRAGLIHDNGFHIVQRLERRAALEQDAALGARANAREVSQRHAEHERARAGDNKEGERGIYPLAPVAGEKAGHDGGQQCNADDSRGVNAGEAGDKAVDLGLARGGVLHAVQDALHHALREHMGDAHLDRAVRVDAARNRAVAHSDAHRHRLACDRRGIQTAFALNDLAVERHAVARADEHDVAHRRVLRREGADITVCFDQIDGLRSQIDRGHDLPTRAFDRTVLEIFAHAVEQHNADRLVERADRPCADRGERHEEVLVEYAALADVFDRGQQHMPAEQQVGRQHDDHLGHAVRQKLARNEQSRADQNFRERVAVAPLLLILGRDDAGLALDGFTDLTDPGEQGVRIFAGHAQLLSLVDQHTVVHAVELADLVLHFRRAVRAAEVLDGVHALIALAVVLGRGHDDFGLVLNRLADLADLGEQGVRVFAGHAQLFGLIDQHAVVHAVELADLVLHFGGAVRAAEVLHCVDAFDAVRTRRVVVFVPVVMTAGAFTIVVVMFVMVVAAAARIAVVVFMPMAMAAVTSIIMMVVLVVVMIVLTVACITVVMVLMLVVVVTAVARAVMMVVLVVMMVMSTVAFATVVVMVVVHLLSFAIVVVNMIFYIGMFSTVVVLCSIRFRDSYGSACLLARHKLASST